MSMAMEQQAFDSTAAGDDFCRALPKVELHAHLNGSCRDSTLRELAQGDPSITHDCAHLLSTRGESSAAGRALIAARQSDATGNNDVLTW